MYSFLLILSLFYISSVLSKTSHCRLKFKEEDVSYCTKFAAKFSQANNLLLEYRAKHISLFKNDIGSHYIEMGLFKDDVFEEIIQSKSMNCNQKRNKAALLQRIDLPYNGKFGVVNKYEYSQIGMQQQNISNQDEVAIWYFVAMDCEHVMHSKFKNMPKIEVEVKVMSERGANQFSYEEQGMLSIHVILFFVFTSLFGGTIYAYMQYYKEYSRMDSPHFVIALAIFLQIGGIFFQVLHLWMYSHNGQGIAVMDIFSNISNMMSEITLSILLIMIANGWTLTYQDIEWDNNIEFYLPMGSIVLAIHLVLCALTYVDIDAYNKFHDFAGVQGWVLLVLKLLIFAYYQYVVQTTKSTIPKRSQEFYSVFSILGSLQLLSVPITIVTSFMFIQSNRQFVYTITAYSVQFFTSALLLQQQMSTKSKYFKASLSGKGILPTDKFD